MTTRQPAPEYDLLIRNGRLIDGTGNPWRRADVAIRGDTIDRVGRLPATTTARVTIDAHDQWVAPGFIDTHTHSDLPLLVDGRAMSKVFQGVTTEVLGEDSSVAPVVGEHAVEELRLALDAYGLVDPWHSLADYFERLEQSGTSVNVASYVGAGQLRCCVMGHEPRAATSAELDEMKRLLGTAMGEGALGLSTGLIYVPGRFASTEELIALAKVVAAHGGIYAGHLRDEGPMLLAAIDEAIRIGQEGNLPVDIFHLKAAGPRNWGLLDAALGRIGDARQRGLDIGANVYPYTASATGLDVRFPTWARAEGPEALVERLRDPELRARIKLELEQQGDTYGGPEGFGEAVIINQTYQPANERWHGKTLGQVAEARAEDVFDALIELLISEGGRGTASYFIMSDHNLAKKIVQPWVSIGSDGSALAPEGPLAESSPHPRSYGTFPRVIAEYVRERGLLNLEDAVRKMSGLPAGRLGIPRRGLVQPGFFADLVVFDAERIRDRASFGEPHRLSTGVAHLLVNGVAVIRDGEHTGARPGRGVRR